MNLQQHCKNIFFISKSIYTICKIFITQSRFHANNIIIKILHILCLLRVHFYSFFCKCNILLNKSKCEKKTTDLHKEGTFIETTIVLAVKGTHIKVYLFINIFLNIKLNLTTIVESHDYVADYIIFCWRRCLKCFKGIN